jgi:hypothetical protein
MIVAACSMHAADAQGAEGVTVSGNRFIKNGKPWVPQGFSLVSIVAPPGRAASGSFSEASGLYGPQLLAQAHSLGANTLRFQVSQPGLDPQSPIYDPGYAQEIVDKVRQARAAGFVAIVSMQWEKPAGLPGQPNMPGDSTLRAWSSIAKPFAHDGDVMLELFNEPAMFVQNPQTWPAWQQGMQAVVDELRSAGAQNVLILDGVQSSHILAGAPSVNDPLRKLAFGVHPYIVHPTDGPPMWEAQWGQFADSHPVVATEWNALPGGKNCRDDTAEASQELFGVMARRHIGVMVWALDMPNTIVDGSGALLNFQNFQCTARGAGAASLAVQYMKSAQ